MKKKLLLIIMCCFSLQLSGLASHLIGAEINYERLAPNTYNVKLIQYLDCAGGANLPSSASIQIVSFNCNLGRAIALSQTGQQVKQVSGSNLPAGCNATSQMSMRIVTYSGVLTFTASEATCPDWVLRFSECCRSITGNLVNTSGSDFYTEAHLKLLPNLINSSPRFDTINFNISYTGVNQPILISALAQDPDGDSLVYTSVAPMSTTAQTMSYTSFQSAGSGTMFNPHPLPPYNTLPFGQPGSNQQIAILLVGNLTYSAAWPLPSFYVNWNAINPVTGIPFNPVIVQPYFQINSRTGNIRFQPAIYNPSGFPGNNTYALSVLVEEYRKINGVFTKIGSVRRETKIEIMDGNGNSNPELVQIEVNKTFIAEGDLIELRPGVPMSLKLGATDLDTAQFVTMRSNVNAVLPGAVFTSNNAQHPSGSISWTPGANDVRDQPYYFNVVLIDSNNNLRGYHERTIGVRVRNNGNVTGTKNDLSLNASFIAYPNPFSDKVNFRFTHGNKASCIIIYNLLGRQIDVIPVEDPASGVKQVQWKGADKHAAGMYVAKLISGNKTVQTLKFTKL